MTGLLPIESIDQSINYRVGSLIPLVFVPGGSTEVGKKWLVCLSVGPLGGDNSAVGPQIETRRRKKEEEGSRARSNKSGASFEPPVAAEKALSIPFRLERGLRRRRLSASKGAPPHTQSHSPPPHSPLANLVGNDAAAVSTLAHHLAEEGAARSRWPGRPNRSHAHSRCSFVDSCDSAPSARVSRGGGGRRRSLRGEVATWIDSAGQRPRTAGGGGGSRTGTNARSGTRQILVGLLPPIHHAANPTQPNSQKPIPHHRS